MSKKSRISTPTATADAWKRTDYAWPLCQRQAFEPRLGEIRRVASQLDTVVTTRQAVREGEASSLIGASSQDRNCGMNRSSMRAAGERRGRDPEALCSASELVEEVRRAGGKHAEQGHAHCHCEIHHTSVSRSEPALEAAGQSDELW
jgi:hypothetical protein